MLESSSVITDFAPFIYILCSYITFLSASKKENIDDEPCVLQTKEIVLATQDKPSCPWILHKASLDSLSDSWWTTHYIKKEWWSLHPGYYQVNSVSPHHWSNRGQSYGQYCGSMLCTV